MNKIFYNYLIGIVLVGVFWGCQKENTAKTGETASPKLEWLDRNFKDSIRVNPQGCLLRLEEVCDSVGSDSMFYFSVRMSIAQCYFQSGKLLKACRENRRVAEFCKRQPRTPEVRDLQFYALNNMGVTLQEMGQRDSAVAYFKQAADYAAGKQLIGAYINIADCSLQSGDYLGCSRYYRKALMLSQGTYGGFGRYAILSGLAKLYMEMGNFQESDLYFRQAGKEVEKASDYERFFFAMARGTFYYLSKDYSASIGWFQRARQLTEKLQQPFNQALAEGNLGELYVLTGKADSARYHLDRATRMFGDNGNDPALKFYMEGLYASLALLENDLTEAERLLSQPFNPSDIIPQYLYYHNLRMEQLYRKKHDYRKAYRYKAMAELYNDSLHNIRVQNNMAEIESRYRQDTTLLRKDIQLSHAQAESRQWKLITVGTAFGLLALLLLAVFFMLYNKKKKDLLFQKQKSTIAGLRMEIVRNRVSPHFIFNALNIILPAFRNYKELEQPLRLLVNVLKGNLQFSDKMVVTIEQEMTLVKEYLQLRQMGSPGHVSVVWDIADDMLLQQVIPAMSIQIPVENAVKYAFTEEMEHPNVCVRICDNGSETVITIDDNGLGYNPAIGANDRRSTGNGLKILYQTIELLNTRNRNKMKFRILNKKNSNNPGQGTFVMLSVPHEYQFNL